MNMILFPTLLLFIVIVIVIIAPKIRSKIGSIITWKRSLILAGIYLGILCMSVPILYLLPDKGFIKLVENSNEVVNHQFLLEGDLDKQPGLYKSSSYTFKVDTNKLTFNVADNMANYRILVERMGADDGVIEVYTYVSTQLTGGIDLTKLVLPPIIKFQQGMLSLESNKQQRLDFKQFNTDFTAEQLKDLNRVNGKGTLNQFGEKFIYLRVPKYMELDKGNYDGQIQMISST